MVPEASNWCHRHRHRRDVKLKSMKWGPEMRKKLAKEIEAGRLMGTPWSASGMSGAFEVKGPGTATLRIIATDASQPNACGWEHVSVTTNEYRTPTWEEMCFVKNAFWGPDEAAMQVHPPEIQYVNNHPYCLHLWRHARRSIPLPPSALVGIKGEEYKTRKEAAAGLIRAIISGQIR